MPKAWDIETIPNKSVQHLLPPPKAKSNLKDPAKIAASIQESREAMVKKMALSPFTGRIACYATAGDSAESSFLTESSDDAERVVIKDCFEMINETLDANQPIVTFNGIGFDFPFLFKRAAILRVENTIMAPYSSFVKRYSTNPHCDLRMTLTDWDSHSTGTLGYFTKLVGLPEKEELDYSTFLGLIEAGKGKVIADNCLQHCQVTFDLYKIFKDYLTIPSTSNMTSHGDH